jgi:hypothetical protein
VAGASGLQAPSTTAAGAGPLGCKWPWRLPAALGVFMKLTLLIAIAGVVLALIDFFGWARHGERAVRSFVGWMLRGGNWLTTTLYYLGWGALIAFIEGPHVTLHERAKLFLLKFIISHRHLRDPCHQASPVRAVDLTPPWGRCGVGSPTPKCVRA